MYQEAVLKRNCQETLLIDFDILLKNKRERNDSGPLDFAANKYSSLANAEADYNLALYNYKKMEKQENYLRDALKNDGLTDAQIEEVATKGKYVKFVSEKQKKIESEKLKDDTNYMG
jgi:hypothetical protein